MKSKIENSKSKMPSGTREWSDTSINCCLGCSHGCVYCYARAMPPARYMNHGGAKWVQERPISPELIRAKGSKYNKRYPGVVMFPTLHDITPGTVESCMAALHALLVAGNKVLLVTKPHLELMPRIVATARAAIDESPTEPGMRYYDEGLGRNYTTRLPLAGIEVRCSVTCLDDDVRRIWEPQAPEIQERIEALRYLHEAAIATSVSIEPCLQPDKAAQLVGMLDHLVSGTIWIGKLNKMAERINWTRGATSGLDEQDYRRLVSASLKLERQQTDQAVLAVYEQLKGNPKVRWKDSYREPLERLGRLPIAH